MAIFNADGAEVGEFSSTKMELQKSLRDQVAQMIKNCTDVDRDLVMKLYMLRLMLQINDVLENRGYSVEEALRK